MLPNGRFGRTGVRLCLAFLAALLCLSSANAETVRDASHLVPTGKGWGRQRANAPKATVRGNGINYHGGPIMPKTPNVYFIWYGNWSSGPMPSDSSRSVSLLQTLFSAIGGSGYENINTTYYQLINNTKTSVSGNLLLAGSATDSYSQGTKLTDSQVQAVVANAINKGAVLKDTNGIYFVLTSSDVNETSGFCTQYCGWHTHGNINGADIKYAFVGNPDRCPSACEWQTVSPNGDSGADGMASVMAHEAEEMLTDPDLNAWYDTRGEENADKCAWKFGPVQYTASGAQYNQTLAGLNWLIQMNWENARGGGCDQKLGGTFYTN